MTTPRRNAPKDLARNGKAFWKVTTDEFELNESERRLLHECCRIMDELDDLRAAVMVEGVTSTGAAGQPKAHPALAAMSSHRGVLGRLLGQINLPYEGDGSMLQSPSQVSARKAARARWAKHGQAG